MNLFVVDNQQTFLLNDFDCVTPGRFVCSRPCPTLTLTSSPIGMLDEGVVQLNYIFLSIASFLLTGVLFVAFMFMKRKKKLDLQAQNQLFIPNET